MSFYGIAQLLLTTYGPLALGWLAFLGACIGMWRMHRTHRQELEAMYREHREDLSRITESVTSAMTENTKATTTLVTRMEDWVLRRRHDV